LGTFNIFMKFFNTRLQWGHSTTSWQSSSKKLQSGVIGMCKKIKVVNFPVILQECKNTHFWTSLNQCTWCDQNFTVVVTIAS
jgi:hypothetical protein